MPARQTRRRTTSVPVLIGVGLALSLVGLVVALVVTGRDDHDRWPGQGTKWEGTLASTVFAMDAETGEVRWQRSLPGEPQLIAMTMPRPGIITLEGIILDRPCTGRPVSVDLDARTGSEVGHRSQLSFTDRVPAPPHGPVVATGADRTYRVEAGPPGPLVRAVSGAGETRWQRAFPDPGDHFMSVPDVVTGVLDQEGRLLVAGSADYLGPRQCGNR
jgi:outer membrane protein assembly factor BamB